MMFHSNPLRLFPICMCSLFQIMHHAMHGIKFSSITQRLFKRTILSRDTAWWCACLCVCVRVWYWLMFSSHIRIRIPSHPTLQCPLSLSLIAGRVRLNAHMGASEESLLQRGGGDGMGILQLREEDAPGQQAIDRNCPAAPSRNTKVRLRLANWTCELAAQFKHPVAKSRDGLHTVSRIAATDCSCWSRKLDLKPLRVDFLCENPVFQISGGDVTQIIHTGVLKKTQKQGT